MPSIRRPAAALALICAAQFILQLDFSIVNVALPSIQRELHFSAAHLQWLVTGYALTFGSLLLLGGRIGDLMGHRRLMVLGLTLFGLSSLLAGLSNTSALLIIARFLQGASAAVVAPSALALLTTIFEEGPARVRALGMFQGATAAGAMTGIVLGGLLTEYVGWRSIFLVNPPLVAILLAFTLRLLPSDAPGEHNRLDIAGATLVTASVGALIYGLSEGQQQGFAAPVAIISLFLAIGLGAMFITFEKRTTTPMLPLGLFSDRPRRIALGAVVVIGAVLSGYVYFISLYLQTVVHFSAVRTGMALVPATATVMVVSMLFTRRLIPRLGTKKMLVLGLTSLGIGQLWLSSIEIRGDYVVDVLGGLLLTALGIGIALPTASVAVTSGVSTDHQGMAGGLFVAAQQIGIATGLAALATLAAARTGADGGSLVAGYKLSFFVGAMISALAAVIVALSMRARARHRRGRRGDRAPRLGPSPEVAPRRITVNASSSA